MKRQIISLLLTLALALGLCAGAVAAPAWSVADGAVSVSGLAVGQHAFAAGYDAHGRFLGTRVLSADGAVQPIPGAAETKLFWTDGQYAPLGEAVRLPQAYQTVRKVDGQVTLCYEGPDGVSVTQPVTEKITGSAGSFNKDGELGISGQLYPATVLTVEGCDYIVSKEGFQGWMSQSAVYPGDTLDFYLDPWGAICWIDLVEAYEYPVETWLLLSAEVTGTVDGGAIVMAELLFPEGGVRTVNVSSLDGQPVTDPSAAAAQLSVHAPGGFYACQRQRDGSYSLALTENTPGSGWGAILTIPTDTVTAQAVDFTQGAVNCLANDETFFAVSWGLPGEEEFAEYTYWNLPAVNVFQGTVVPAEGDPTATPVARFVYLRTLDKKPSSAVELPDGCIFLAGNGMTLDPELAEDGVYLVDIVDTDGTRASIRITAELARTIQNDSMDPGQFAGNTYVGKFCAVTEIDENRTISALEPVAAADVTALENGVIETAAGSWSYDDLTVCVYVDLADGGSGQVTLSGCGTFGPDNGFVDLGDVSADPADRTTYRSVRAVVIAALDTPSLADYIYIVREIW